MNADELRLVTPIQHQVVLSWTQPALRASRFVGSFIFLWLLWPAACGNSVVAFAGEPAHAQSDSAAEQDDMDRLAGYWALIEMKSDGEPFGEPRMKGMDFWTKAEGDSEQWQEDLLPILEKSAGKPYPEAPSYMKRPEVLLSSGRRQLDYVVIDSSTTPKHWDFVIEPLGGQVVTRYVLQGIYVLDGDSLVICLTKSLEAPRPEDFECVEGSNRYLLVLKRNNGIAPRSLAEEEGKPR